MTLDERLQAMQARCEAIKSGRWYWAAYGGREYDTLVTDSIDGDVLDEPTPVMENIELANDDVLANFDFIAHARQDLPRLLAGFKILLSAMVCRDNTYPGQHDEKTCDQCKALAHAERLLKGDSPDAR